LKRKREVFLLINFYSSWANIPEWETIWNIIKRTTTIWQSKCQYVFCTSCSTYCLSTTFEIYSWYDQNVFLCILFLFLIIIDVKTGYIPYVEDSDPASRSSHRQLLQRTNDDDMNKNNGLGLCKFWFLVVFSYSVVKCGRLRLI
jgi:hypothetical protein